MKLKKRTWYLMFGRRKTNRYEVVVWDLKKNLIVFSALYSDAKSAEMRLRHELGKLAQSKRLAYGQVTHNGHRILRLDVLQEVVVHFYVA